MLPGIKNNARPRGRDGKRRARAADAAVSDGQLRARAARKLIGNLQR